MLSVFYQKKLGCFLNSLILGDWRLMKKRAYKQFKFVFQLITFTPFVTTLFLFYFLAWCLKKSQSIMQLYLIFILFYFLDWFIQHTMGKLRKLNIIQNDGQSQAKEQSIESSTEVNQNNNSILEENA